MADARTFSICQGCGTWRETGSDLISFLADYDIPFFIQDHMACCPLTGKPETLISVSEADENFCPPDPEKEWRPDSFSGYKPRQEPKFERHSGNVRDHLIGIWSTNNFGGHSDETLVLWADGKAALDFYNVTFCGRTTFEWTLDGQNMIRMHGSDDLHYFRINPAYFEIGSFTSAHGEKTDLMRMFARGRENSPIEFYRTITPLEDYRIPTEGSS